MFDGNVTIKPPKNTANCNDEDAVAASLWKWTRTLEIIGRVFAGLFAILGILAGVLLSDSVPDSSAGILVFLCLFTGALLGAISYLVFHIAALNMGAKARVVQNTTVLTRIGLLNLYSSGDGHKGNPEKIEKRISGTAPAPPAHTPAPTVHSFEELTFGKYMQSGTSEKESITWKILHKEGNKALVISKYALDCKPYNDTETGVTWETCSLRKWLNGEFLNSAFSEKEKEKILTTNVTAESNPKYDTPAGNDTEDKVFLLSINQSKEYFESASERSCKATIYSRKQGADTKIGDFCWWWLRSPGYDSYIAALVNTGGSVSDYGYSVNYAIVAVRPAMWIKLD